MIETGGDFSDNNVPNRAKKTRIKNIAPIRENTAPVPNVNNLVDSNFLAGTMSGNIIDPSDTTSNSLIANKNRLMANQVQQLAQTNPINELN